MSQRRQHNWMVNAACAGMDVEIFFDVMRPQRALKTCGKCPVRRECREYVKSWEPKAARYGIYGGQTPSVRTALA